MVFRGRPKYSVSEKSDTRSYEVAYPRASGPTAPGSSFRADNGFIYLSKYKFDPVSSAFEDIETSLVLLDTARRNVAAQPIKLFGSAASFESEALGMDRQIRARFRGRGRAEPRRLSRRRWRRF